MAMAVGYNVQKASDLMQALATKYAGLDQIIVSEYKKVSATLRENWVGEDEQHYEQYLANKFNYLYAQSGKLVEVAVQNIYATTLSWIEFQRENRFKASDGTDLVDSVGVQMYGGSSISDITAPAIDIKTNIISYEGFTIPVDADRGLASTDSATTIQNAIGGAVQTIKDAVDAICGELKVSEAFFGDQLTSIEEYMTQVHKSVGEIITAVQDISTALNQMAGEQYTGAGDAGMSGYVSGQMTTAAQDMSSTTSDYAGKWTA